MYKIFCVITIVVLSACDSGRDKRYSGFHLPYIPDMEQGNIVDNQEKEKLSLGMSKAEVSQLIGEPLLIDDFNKNHWIYAKLERIKGGDLKKTQFSLLFEDDELIKIE